MTTFRELYPALGAGAAAQARPARPSKEPLLLPGRGSRATPVFNVHSYHTKVPPEAIEPFIAHHTRPGQLVLDPFSGSGMTGVAALRLGRRVVLSDLAPAAAHIAWNVTHPCDPAGLQTAAAEVLQEIAPRVAAEYASRCDRCGGPAAMAYAIWSDVLRCTACGGQVSVWDAATDHLTGTLVDRFPCPHCATVVRRRGAQREARRLSHVATDCIACGRRTRPATGADVDHATTAPEDGGSDWYPTTPIGPSREMYLRSALHLQGIQTVADFYTPRNLRVLAALWAAIGGVPDLRVRQALALAFTNTAWHGTIMRRYNARGGQRPLTGTLYVPHLSSEVNVARVFSHKIRQLDAFYRQEPGLRTSTDGAVQVDVASATDLPRLADGSVDYIFTDPPFGSNLFYADCNLIWEAWLGEHTRQAEEAVVNRSLKPADGGKTLTDYSELMRASFAEMGRVLRPAGWLTLIFHSTDVNVWRAIETAAADAGLSIEGATYLDKRQLSHKGYKGADGREDVAAYDVVLAIRNRRPTSGAARAARQRRQRHAVDILERHLGRLRPVGDRTDDQLRRLPYLHSLLVQHHFNGDIGLHVGGYDLVREICRQHFQVDAEGRWAVVTRIQLKGGSRAASKAHGQEAARG
jgi:16S rRNA G966 N2-methylase RsmD